MLRHHGAAAGNGIVKNEVAAGGVIQNEAVSFEELNYSPGLKGRKFGHALPLYQLNPRENQ
jgi:hypothetical protein